MGRRLGARLIDGLILSVIYIAFLSRASRLYQRHAGLRPERANYYSCVTSQGNFASAFGAVFGALMICGLLYEWLMIGLVGATLGKMAVGPPRG